MTSLQGFEKGKFPRSNKRKFRKKHATLKKLFAKTQKKNFRWGTVEALDVKKTHDAWFAMRDAWVVFGKTKYPAVSPYSLMAWLTDIRIKMLADFF